MYKALGITGESNRLITAIYNFVGPIASKSSPPFPFSATPATNTAQT